MRRLQPWLDVQAGSTLLETLIAVGIMTIIVAAGAKLMLTSSQSQTAIDARSQLRAEAGLLSQQLTRSFRERNNPQTYRGDLSNGGSSVAIERTLTSDFTTIAVANFTTACVPVPSQYRLPEADLRTLANLAMPSCNPGASCTACLSCPFGQMAVVSFSDTGTRVQRYYPAQGRGQSKSQKPIAGGLCIEALAASMAGQGDLLVTISMAVIDPQKPVTVIKSAVTLSSTIVDPDVSIMH